MKKLSKLSAISILHYLKLFGRSFLLLVVLGIYIYKRIHNTLWVTSPIAVRLVIDLIWLIWMVEMALRFFPSKFESMGCQKQFKRNYRPVAGKEARLTCWKSTLAMALCWFALNGLIGGAYFLGWIDEGILFLIALVYSVCDMICILFFCPFQTWFMKNKCCGTCRIYNWDFAMMFTPLVFVPHFYTWSLLGVALLLLVFWEVLLHKYPERFLEETNENLHCKNCKEKLCGHKKQLQSLLRKRRFMK